MQVGEALAPWPSYLGLDGAPAPSYNQEGRLMTPLQGWEPTGLRPGCLAHSQDRHQECRKSEAWENPRRELKGPQGHSGFCFGSRLREE